MCPEITVQIKFDSFEEPDAFQQLANYPSAFAAIAEFASELRQIRKYRELSEPEQQLIDEIHDKFYSIFEGLV